MKFTINGFSQEVALSFKKTVSNDGKGEKQIKLDCTDLVILRWFVDFFPFMKKMNIDGKEYAWLTHKKMIEDLPILDISKRACIDRMQKLVEFEILDYKLIKDGGTFSLYGFGKRYQDLVQKSNETEDCQTTHGMQSNSIGGMQSNNTGVCSQTNNKDTSIKDNSIIDTSIKKERKKETTYDAILAVVENDSLRDLYYEYIKMRKLIKSPMTDRALKMLIDKVNKLEPNSIDRQKQLLETAIMNNWKSVYPLKDNNSKGYSNASQLVTINGVEYEYRNGKHYIPNGNGIAVNPYAEDDLPFLN